jgi:hypothetical protein
MSKVLLTYTPDAKGNVSRERLQLHPRYRSLAGIKRDNCRVYEREQLSTRRPACYIATPPRFSTTLQRARHLAFRPRKPPIPRPKLLSYALLHSPATSPAPCSTPGASTIITPS